MDLNARKDHFSRAVVRAIAAAAGVGATVPEFDQNSEDINFAAPDEPEGPGAKLDAQLKCSQNIDPAGETFPFDLPVKNYNALRQPTDNLFVPRLLVVVHVPADPDDWFRCDPEKIVMQRCAYWVDLAGREATDNQTTIRIEVPTAQVFDPAALRANLRRPGEAL
jgi:hypothetical protein